MRRRYIVDPKFQWTVVGYTILISMLTTMVNQTIDRIEIYREMQQRDGIFGIVSAYVRPEWLKPFAYGSFYLGVFIVAVLFSNRLAGPLYRLRRHMIESARGQQIVKIFFRKNDYYTELNHAYNELADAVNRREKERLFAARNEDGFSLPELMVVVAIISILGVISAVTIFEKPKDQFLFKQDVSNFADALVTARNSAVTKNQCAFVTVVNPTTVTINTYPIPSPCDQTPLPAPDIQITHSLRVGTTASDFSTGSTLIFRPSGGTTATGPVNITLTGVGGLTNRFVIYPAIGQVRAQ